MKIGIDVGLSNVHIASSDGFFDSFEKSDDFSIEEYLLRFKKIGTIHFSGDKRFHISKFYNKKVHIQNEIRSIGKGGLSLAKRKKGIIVSCGTGTCIVMADKRYEHVSGSSIGGGTILGLSELLLGTSDPKKIRVLAKKGDVTKVDYVLKDLGISKLGFLTASSSVSHFANLKKHNKSDLALGILNMVGQNIANLAGLAARAYKQNNIILIGKVLDFPIKGIIKKRLMLINKNTKLFLPKNYEFATATGNIL